MRNLPQLLIGLVALALAVVVAAFVASSAVRDVKRARDTITVTGSAKQPITADLIAWNLSVSAQDADPAFASKTLKARAAQVRAFLRNGGVTDAELSEPPVSTEQVDVTLPDKTRSSEYRLTQSFDVTSRAIDRVHGLAARVTDLLGRGVPVSAQPLQYVSTQLTQARLAALQRATHDARTRAETIVHGIGGHLGGARKAELGVYQVTPRNSTDVSDYGINDTTTREKDVTAVVTVTFALSG